MRIDLHTHSSASDGTDPPAEVMERARARGLDVIALTDHDTVGGLDEARAALPPGLTLVPGMELSATLDGRSLHLLAYLFDPDYPPLAEAVASIRDDRVRRARVMVDKLAALGYRHAVALRPNLLADEADALRGHEFRYSTWVRDEPAAADGIAWRMRGTRADAPVDRAGFADGNLLASYLHIHFGQRAEIARRFVARLSRSF